MFRHLILIALIASVALTACNSESREPAAPPAGADSIATGTTTTPTETAPVAGRGRHGGVVKSSGVYSIEFAQMNGYPAIYLLDQSGNGLPAEGLTADLILTRNGETSRIPLPPMGDHFMSADPIDLTTPGIAVVSIVVVGNSLTARFDLPLSSDS